MSKTRCSSKLHKAAVRAATAANKNREAQMAWVEAFREEYGHDDVSDMLVEVIDYGGDTSMLTREYIHENSREGES